jgi:AraC-like DNA-binding protein
MSDTLLASASRILWRMIKAEGADPDAIFTEAGLDKALRNKSTARYPAEKARKAWQLAADYIRNPCFGISAGVHWLPSDLYALGYAFLSSGTLHVGLNRIVLYNEVVDSVITFIVEEDDEHLILSYENARKDLPDHPALEDARWGIVLAMCRAAKPEGISPVKVELTHASIKCRKEYESFFGCPITYSQRRSALYFKLADVNQTLTAVNTEVAAINEKALRDYIVRLREDDLQHRVARVITEQLASGHLSINKVAKALFMSSRTLQRKLSTEETTFKQTLELIRKRLAMEYIKDERLSFSEISYLLGFSEQSSFTRGFKRWTGATPRQARAYCIASGPSDWQ